MSRKKWTPQTEVDDALLQFREKRKWQIALRRYVLEQNKSTYYAPFFGLDNTKFREWIAVQFDSEMNWDNFSSLWQFDHVVPIAYFDFNDKDDLSLCWNFTNIRVEKVSRDKTATQKVDALSAKKYFETLLQQTGYVVCQEMIAKISRLEEVQMKGTQVLSAFITGNNDYLQATQNFSSEDFERLNTGTELRTLLIEKEFLKKFGG
jgi:hypothetical protein